MLAGKARMTMSFTTAVTSTESLLREASGFFDEWFPKVHCVRHVDF